MRFLTPTQNKRLNELVGFLCISLAVLIALALLSYFPRDASFNVSAQPSDVAVTNNWMGPVGANASDLLFQVFGFAAFLLPAAVLVIGWRWCRSRASRCWESRDPRTNPPVRLGWRRGWWNRYSCRRQ